MSLLRSAPPAYNPWRIGGSWPAGCVIGAGVIAHRILIAKHKLLIKNKRVIVVLPAYNAAKTLERTIAEIPRGIVDEFLLVDDASRDDTVEPARRLGIPCIVHPRNRGYGGNQKTCYTEALRRGADIVVMLHPDYQYTPKLIGAMAWLVASGEFDVVLGSRILGTGALKGGMPFYKYVANRFLTAVENILLGIKLSEFHTGYRAFCRGGAGDAAPGRELRRLRLRQPDARPGGRVRFPDRRDLLPDEILSGGLVDQLPPFGDLWVRCPGDGAFVPAPPLGRATEPAPGPWRPAAVNGARPRCPCLVAWHNSAVQAVEFTNMSRSLIGTLIFVMTCTASAWTQERMRHVLRPTTPAGPLVGQWRASGTDGAVVAGGAEAVEAGLRCSATAATPPTRPWRRSSP